MFHFLFYQTMEILIAVGLLTFGITTCKDRRSLNF